jgi:Na+-transporting methylmalonyl-CoA/oxaloacetate decarboxylase gamma subunit
MDSITMILEALKVMAFGMLGIFFVMGAIITFAWLLGISKKDETKENLGE